VKVGGNSLVISEKGAIESFINPRSNSTAIKLKDRVVI